METFRNIRTSVFETNSSSAHSLILKPIEGQIINTDFVTKEEIEKGVIDIYAKDNIQPMRWFNKRVPSKYQDDITDIVVISYDLKSKLKWLFAFIMNDVVIEESHDFHKLHATINDKKIHNLFGCFSRDTISEMSEDELNYQNKIRGIAFITKVVQDTLGLEVYFHKSDYEYAPWGETEANCGIYGYEEVFKDEASMKNFLFNKESYIESSGNDNPETEEWI